MNRACTRMHVYERRNDAPRGYRAAVSLHCHTQHSKELLTFIPHYAAMIPIVSRLFRTEMDRYLTLHGKTVDFARAWWTPPATPQHVVEAETLQIEKEFGLPALVSITDHDDITAGQRLQVIGAGNRCPISPISMEWTVPFGRGFFHLGVHNLPRDQAVGMAAEMRKYTAGLDGAMPLRDLLAMLNESPETLVVLNHPLWDIEYIGKDEHADCLGAFLGEHERWIHAFEINGFRSWRENDAVLRMAADFGIPAVAGGDRHGLQPNTLLNLTQAGCFAEYAAEIREDLHGDVLMMPEYRESMVARTIEVVADVIRHYPNHPMGQSKWTDRVFVDTGNGLGSCALSHHWPRGGPAWVRAALWCMRTLGARGMKSALRLALAGERVSYEN